MIEWVDTAMIVFLIGLVVKNTKDIGHLCGHIHKK